MAWFGASKWRGSKFGIFNWAFIEVSATDIAPLCLGYRNSFMTED